MENPISDTVRIPGMVIFSAVLNFISSGFGFLMMAIGGIGLLFGSLTGIAEFFQRQMSAYSQTMNMGELNLSAGISLIFIVLFILGLLIAAASLIVGLALLKGKRWAWYAQVITSVIGLLGFPFWTVLNGIILYIFFCLD